MRISDWSSDVCSSDLQPQHVRPRALHIAQIIGVIDDARQIGVLEIDARPVMMRRADEGAGNEGGRGDGHLKRAIAVARLAAKPRFTICRRRSEEHTSELQSLMRISYAVFCLKKKNN